MVTFADLTTSHFANNVGVLEFQQEKWRAGSFAKCEAILILRSNSNPMKVLGIAILDEAQRIYPYAKSAISRWKTITDGAKWKHYEDLKQHFNGTDAVGKCVVFDIKHNDFRLIAIVDYARSIVIVKAFLKHSDYDKDKWKNECGC